MKPHIRIIRGVWYCIPRKELFIGVGSTPAYAYAYMLRVNGGRI